MLRDHDRQAILEDLAKAIEQIGIDRGSETGNFIVRVAQYIKEAPISEEFWEGK